MNVASLTPPAGLGIGQVVALQAAPVSSFSIDVLLREENPLSL
jgi:hypothetical protein